MHPLSGVPELPEQVEGVAADWELLVRLLVCPAPVPAGAPLDGGWVGTVLVIGVDAVR